MNQKPIISLIDQWLDEAKVLRSAIKLNYANPGFDIRALQASLDSAQRATVRAECLELCATQLEAFLRSEWQSHDES